MALGLNVTIRNARLQVLINALDAAATPGTIKFYTTAQPATGGAITTQTLLGTCVLSDPSATIAAGVLTFDAVTDDISADADGTIAWARGEDGDGNFVFDGDCGITGSGALFIFNTLVARIGGIIQVLSGALTEGNS